MVSDSWADYLYVYSGGVWTFARVGIGGVNTPLASLAAELEHIGENEHVS